MNDPENTKKDISDFELEEALRQEGCAVCRLADQAGRSYLDNLLYESVNDPDVQREFRDSLGLCNPHAYQMLDNMGSGLGTAILYRVAVRELLNLLSEVPESKRAQTPLSALLGSSSKAKPTVPEPGTGCMVCEAEGKVEERYLKVLLEGAENGSLGGLLDGSGTVCVRHLSQASLLTGGWLPPSLIEALREALEDLNADLERYVRHNDHRFRDEPWGKERDSPRRIVGRMVGRRGRKNMGRA